MDAIENSYCRLCANLKSNTKLVNLQFDEDRRCKILDKLTRFNLNIELTEQSLPSTVCHTCITSLDKAFDFVVEVEKAQDILQDAVLSGIKREAGPSDDDSFRYSPGPDDYVDVKVKEEDGAGAPNTSKKRQAKCAKRQRKKLKLRSDLDAIPLSQLKLTWQDYTWQCSYCDTQFPTIEELQSHSIQYHECCNAYRCTDCNIRKLKLDSFLSHVKRHRKYLKLSCYKCFQRFPKALSSRLHRTTHRTTGHICSGCNSCFETSAQLIQHSDTYNRDKKTRQIPKIQDLDDLKCVLCQKTFKYRGSLNTHLLTHTDRKRDHTCEKCGKCFFNKQNLAGHMLLHDDVRPFQCEICKFRFRTSGQLRSHVGVHDGVKPFACDQCGRCFRLSKQLASHKIIHTDILPYVCTYCNKSFRFKTILNQHLRQHTGVKPYSCQFCLRDFTNWPNYNKHMKRRHSLDMAKKKHTPDGVFPINPATGEVIINLETDKTIEWKKKVLSGSRKPGRPKVTNVNADEPFGALGIAEDSGSHVGAK
ncbi:gastrula zinc finger protein XlCGF57.1-like [Aricia agestis]|uniref:gastrula zinc finger protein XlCGF57.1-like n=1 Tax=Aricia agestis TaxID=91739 RepID=UPI001C20B5D6|nr:gastrula zinc finger protein XlCGF57.1-like [Aricia agestis]